MRPTWLGPALAVALAVAACSGDDGSPAQDAGPDALAGAADAAANDGPTVDALQGAATYSAHTFDGMNDMVFIQKYDPALQMCFSLQIGAGATNIYPSLSVPAGWEASGGGVALGADGCHGVNTGLDYFNTDASGSVTYGPLGPIFPTTVSIDAVMEINVFPPTPPTVTMTAVDIPVQ